VLNAMLVGVMRIGNEIATAGMNRQVPDPEYANAAQAPSFGLARTQTDHSRFTPDVNTLFHASANVQLEYCSAMHAACVATNRFYSAAAVNERQDASMHLQEIARRFEKAKLLQRPASESLLELADGIVASGADEILTPEVSMERQADILRSGRFSPAAEDLLQSQISHFDPYLVRLFHPHAIARQCAMALRVEAPVTLSAVLRREAKCSCCWIEQSAHFPASTN
jgi:hypothetical protein